VHAHERNGFQQHIDQLHLTTLSCSTFTSRSIDIQLSALFVSIRNKQLTHGQQPAGRTNCILLSAVVNKRAELLMVLGMVYPCFGFWSVWDVVSQNQMGSEEDGDILDGLGVGLIMDFIQNCKVK
jgi:hypothetical protein